MNNSSASSENIDFTPSANKDSDDESDEAPDLVEVPGDINIAVPVTILAGFLGSGKTTLLNHILTANHGRRIAVIENEFGEGLGVESMIAKSGVDGESISNFFELSNGCICCTVKDDLLTTLEQLIIHKDRFDYIIIETTGVANPGPVISSFWSDKELGSVLKLDGVVCVVDSFNFENYLTTEDVSVDVRTQLCFADRILLNKSDLVSSDQMSRVKSHVKEINSYAEMQPSTYSKVNLDFVLNTNSYLQEEGTDASIGIGPHQFMQCIPCGEADTDTPDEKRTDLRTFMETQRDLNQNNHTAAMKTHYLKIPGTFNIKQLETLLDGLLYSGIKINDTSIIEGAVINRQREQHDEDFSSVQQHDSSAPEGTIINSKAFSHYSNPHTMKIYRMKGVVHVEESNTVYIMQAVHQLFELLPSSYTRGSPGDLSDGQNLFVIIGQNLDLVGIEEAIRQCLVRNS